VEESKGAARLLRQLREDRGCSLRAAAQDLGVAPSHLSRWERGEKMPSDDLRRRAAAYYGIKDDELALESGRVPEDVLAILKQHPDLLAELRTRFPR